MTSRSNAESGNSAGTGTGDEPEEDRVAATALGQRLDRVIADERQRALRALLKYPLLTTDGPDVSSFRLVRKHADWLRDWLARFPGWKLRVETELFRLHKTVGDGSDTTRQAKARHDDPPFSRRRYVLLCLALASLVDADRQTTLGQLADQVVGNVARNDLIQTAGVIFDLSSRDQRRDLVAAIRLLIELRVLHRVDGDEQGFIDESGDALYTVNRIALASLLHVQRGPSTVDASGFEERLRSITAEIMPNTEESRTRQLRTRLYRRLLDDPVIYYEDLPKDELDYLHSQRSLLLGRIEEATGLIPEIRKEGIAMVEEQGDLSDIHMLEQGTDGHLALLLAEHLAAAIRSGQTPVGYAALESHTAKLINKYQRRWRNDVSEPGAERGLTHATIDRLEALRLVRRTPDGVLPLPAIGRYAVEEPAETQPGLLALEADQ